MGKYYIASNIGQSYYIAHHGIKGQKWGIRRFQNEDGSYTDQGRKRYSARDYQRQLNTLEKQIARKTYEREKAWDKDNRHTIKTMKAMEKGVSNDQVGMMLKKHTLNLKEHDDAAKAVKEGESIMWKTLASAMERGYTVNSKEVLRNASVGRKVFASASGFLGGVVFGVPTAVIGITAYDAIKRKQGYSPIGATGMVPGKQFKVRNTVEGQNPSYTGELYSNGVKVSVVSDYDPKRKK